MAWCSGSAVGGAARRLLVAAALLALGSGPGAAAELWREDLRRPAWQTSLSAAGWWLHAPQRLALEPGEGAVGLRAAGPGGLATLARLVSYDLETTATAGSYPYLVLDLAPGDPEPWGGLTLRAGTRRPARTLLAGATGPGRWVLDLRRHLPELVGRAGDWPLLLTLAGGGPDLPGPATRLRSLVCCAAAPDRVDLDLASPEPVLRRGQELTITVHLAAPAAAVTCDLLRAGPPAAPCSLDGRSTLALARADETGRRWTVTVPVTAAGTAARVPAGELLVRAHCAGREDLGAASWFDLETATPAPLVRTAAASSGPLLPEVDGRLDDEAWRPVSAQGGFVTLGDGQPAAAPTTFRVLAAPEALYLAAICEEPRPEALRTGVTARDGPAWTDDCLELFLAPTRGGVDYRQIVVTAAGTVFDARWTDGRMDATWDGDWQVATGRVAGAWVAELAVPWSSLSLDGPSDPVWGFNLARQRYAGDAPERTSWAPLRAGFHEPERFGRLTGLPDLAAWQITGAPLVAEVDRSGGALSATVCTRLGNQTGRPQDLRATLAARGPAGTVTAHRQLHLARGESAEVRWRLKLPAEGPYDLVWQVEAAVPPGLRLVGRRRLELAYRPLAARWLPLDGEAPAELVAEVTVVGYLAADARVVGELCAGDRVLAAQAVPAGVEPALLRFPTHDLPAGALRCQVVLRRGEEVLGEVALPLTWPPARSAATGGEPAPQNVGKDGP